jgi:transcription elongation factor GreA
MIVSPREVDPSHGRISNASPIGKAIIGRNAGEVIGVITPSGKLQYKIRLIER